jgi:Flp pilus assembly protein TadG
MSLFKAFHERAIAFKNDSKGSMATLFALTFSVMIAFTGAAIDVTRAVQARALLQQATDSAGLAAVNLAISEGADLTTTASFESSVGNFLNANLEAALAENAPTGMSANYTLNLSNGDLVISAEAPIASSFTRIIGVQQMDIGVVTVVRIPSATAPATARAALKG